MLVHTYHSKSSRGACNFSFEYPLALTRTSGLAWSGTDLVSPVNLRDIILVCQRGRVRNECEMSVDFIAYEAIQRLRIHSIREMKIMRTTLSGSKSILTFLRVASDAAGTGRHLQEPRQWCTTTHCQTGDFLSTHALSWMCSGASCTLVVEKVRISFNTPRIRYS